MAKMYVMWRGQMVRRQVVEIKCDRCQRVENQDLVTSPAATEELSVTFQGQTVTYTDLCKRCRGAIENYFKGMTKQVDEVEKVDKPVAPTDKGGFLGMGGKKA
jgi:hypothetical protein